MPVKPISLGLSSNPGRDASAGSARLTNCYAEKVGGEQKAADQIWASDGLIDFATISTSDVRATIEVDGIVYAVSGSRIYIVEQSGTARDIGGIAGGGLVTMARNRRPSPQIAVVCDGNYAVIEGETVTPGWDSDLIPPTSVAFANGYFVFSHADGRLSHTGNDDAQSIDGLAYSAAESSPDRLVRVMGLQQYIIAFGSRSIEWWVDVGGDPFAFQRDFAIQVGCASAASCALVNQTLAFVADDKTVRILAGHEAARVSNHAVERDIADVADPSTIAATSWTARGHVFYAISTAAWTWVYDLTTQTWHNRKSFGLDRWRVSTICEAWNTIVCGDYATGKLYEMRADAYDEAGAHMVVEIITPPVHAWPERVRIDVLFVDMITGVGLPDYVSDPHSGEPVLMMSASYDGGHTWGTERQIEIGRLGEYQRRIIAWRWGLTRSAGITFKLRASAHVMRGFLGAAIQAEKFAA